MSSRRQTLLDYLPAVDQAIVNEFFGAFVAAECELKMRGFIRRGSEDAQVEWDSLVSAIRQRFQVDHSPQFRKSGANAHQQPTAQAGSPGR